MKCVDPKCNFCIQNPVKYTDARNFLKERSFIWFNPLASHDNPGHFRTFIEMSTLDTYASPKGMYVNITL